MDEPKLNTVDDVVCGAPDEPIRRQRQTVAHLSGIDDRSAYIYRTIQEMPGPEIVKTLGSIRLGVWCGVIVIVIDVLRHWQR